MAVAESQSSAPGEENTGPIVEAGAVSSWLKENGFGLDLSPKDHLGFELVNVVPQFFIPVCT
ncbi:MAG: NADH-quinone oxidoreductase subunit C, partial [Cyanobacteria bacterium J06638_6]